MLESALGGSSGLAPSRRSSVLRNLLVTAYYLAGGIFSIAAGLVSSGPSGQSSVVWLPPGIALTAMLVWGKRIWPGVALGSFVLDALMAMREAPSAGIGVQAAIAVVVCCAYVLQALAACALVQRWCGAPLTLDRSRSVLAFLLCGAVTALITSTTGSVSLVLIGVRQSAVMARDLASWWVSDTISVFLVTPVLLAWAGRPEQFWRPRKLRLTVPLCIALALVASAFAQANRLDIERARKQVELRANQLKDSLRENIEELQHSIYMLRDMQELLDTPFDPRQFDIT